MGLDGWISLVLKTFFAQIFAKKMYPTLDQNHFDRWFGEAVILVKETQEVPFTPWSRMAERCWLAWSVFKIVWTEDISWHAKMWLFLPNISSPLILPLSGEQRWRLRQGRFHGNLCQDQALHGLDQEDYQQRGKMWPLENQSVEI